MSRAFVREPDADVAAAQDALPDRLISAHPNFVTATGLQLIDERLRGIAAERDAARARADAASLAALAREQRYWSARRGSAQVIEVAAAPDVIRFGATVTLALSSGARRTYRIVGEDEANPSTGTLSYVSPLAKQLLGRHVGDDVGLGEQQATIVALD